MFKFLLSISPLFYTANTLAHGISEDAKRAMIEGGYLKYIILGAEHMITGYDHLLFLFGVIFFLKTFKDIVKFISVFTVGHSITLIFATFMGITANYFLIDAVIALSVCYKGFDNNNGFQSYFGVKKSPNLLGAVFVFGLIHGFGLSTRLQQLPLGEKGGEMLMRIISFNVGVEVGQIVALTIMLVLLRGIRNRESFNRLSKVANDGLILAGVLLFLMQMHGYEHTSYPDDYGFSKDNHIHHHMDMEKQRTHESKHDNL
ncbi:HupE/UreJ family protein [Halobacteriovorax sp. HLS]|uniref:HupE/UreJ family protein n=1 Tax=Halobacteriovorax sp. HLS TaxID=2234000 RepID=UPI000FD94A35|nr:HupE/UreJ family protein [Halobacteriovorax sp. HLS]